MWHVAALTEVAAFLWALERNLLAIVIIVATQWRLRWTSWPKETQLKTEMSVYVFERWHAHELAFRRKRNYLLCVYCHNQTILTEFTSNRSIGLDCDGRRTTGVNLPCRGYDKWRSAARCRAKKVKLVFPPHQKERLLVNAIISFVCADSVAAPTWAPLLRLKIIWVFRNIARWFQTQHTRRRTVILLPTHHWLDWTFLEVLNDYWWRISKLKPAVLTFSRLPTLVVGRINGSTERK